MVVIDFVVVYVLVICMFGLLFNVKFVVDYFYVIMLVNDVLIVVCCWVIWVFYDWCGCKIDL